MDSCEYESSRKGLSNFKCSMPKMSCFIPNKVIFFRDVATFICNRRYTTFQNVEGSFGSEGRGNPIGLRKHGDKRSEREDKKTEANDVKATFSWHSLCTHVVNTIYLSISHFTVVRLVTWALSRSEAGGDLVLIQTLLIFKCRLCCSHANYFAFTYEKHEGLYQNKVTARLASTQRPGH